MMNILEAIEQTPPSASADRAAKPTDVKATIAVEDENVTTTVSKINRLISDMVADKEVAIVVFDKGKKIEETSLEGVNFDLWHLGGQQLSEEDISQLKEFPISCGYQPGSMLFGGVVEEVVGCIRDRAGAKVISTLSKNIGFLKLEKDIGYYRRQHIIDNLFYSNFKSLLLSKALKMQQDDEDRKNEIVVKGLEDKIKKLEDSLKEKDDLLHSAEGLLAGAQTQNNKLSKELKEAHTLLEENSSRFNRETKALNMTLKVEAEKNMKLSEALRTLKEKCFNFASQCTARLKSMFNSVGAASEEARLSAKDVPRALECVEKEVDVLDKVITGHGDFCALVAPRGTTVAFINAGCNHARAVNRPNFNLSASDQVDIPTEARSIGNRFITQIWAKGDRELTGNEAQNLLNKGDGAEG